MKRTIKAGDKLTIFTISDISAACFRHEMIVKEVRDSALIMCERGKRKAISKSVDNDSVLVLDGHDLGLKADTETGSFWGNACFNLVGESREQIIDVLERTSLKEITGWQRDHLMYKTSDSPDNVDSCEFLYEQTEKLYDTD